MYYLTLLPTRNANIKSAITALRKRLDSFAIVCVAFPYDRPDRLNIFWDDWDDRDDPDDHMET